MSVYLSLYAERESLELVHYALFFLQEYFFFTAQAEYSYFSANFRLKIFLYYS